MAWCQWAVVRFCHICAHSKQKWWWLAVNRDSLWVIGTITMGQVPVVKAGAFVKRFCRTILNNAPSWWGMAFRASPMGLPGTKVPVAAYLQRMQLTVARVRPTRPSISLYCMPSRASASTSCLIPMGLDGALLEQSVRLEKKICNCWFDLATVRRQIWGNDNLSCGFGNWRSQLALKWKSGLGKVGFLWGAVIGRFCVNFSPLETQKFHPYRFYCLKWGVTFSQECIISIIQSWIIHN